MTKINFIAVDWGTTNLRLWAIGSKGSVLDSKSSDQGMGKLTRDQFEPVLLGLIEPWIKNFDENKPLPIIACGMVGARQGWHEAPYQSAPCKIMTTPQQFETNDKRISLYICSGVQQSIPADVMRGEETQIAGLIADDPKFTGVIAMPGTHTKWVCVEHGMLQNFSTVMSGELFELLSTQSVLRHSVDSNDFDETTFLKAIHEATKHPSNVMKNLFNIRARSLLTNDSNTYLRSRLSGLILGMEFASSREFWENKEISLVGSKALSKLYAIGLRELGAKVKICDIDGLTLTGLISAYHQLKGNNNG